ncbi:MAG TPA: arginase family protein [Actinomycetota bacterium]|nr:arginase family protein [Actinomycetota bacterium]
MQVQVIAMPYDLGRRATGVGAGPLRLLDAGLVGALEDAGHSTDVTIVERDGTWTGAADAVAELGRALAAAVRDSCARGAWPLVLAGNCNSAIGTLAGIGPRDAGALWFDAHGDINTPETSPTGYLDGMGLAVATGRCLPELWRAATPEPVLTDDRVVLAGVRALDDGESDLLDRSGVEVVDAARARAGYDALRAPVERLAAAAPGGVYVHLDVDVLDPGVAPGVGFPTPDGVAPDVVAGALRDLGRRGALRALGVTAFDPAADRDDRSVATITELVVVAAAAAG